MTPFPNSAPPLDLREMLYEGSRIIPLIAIWGLLAAISQYGIANIGFGQPGGFFFELGTTLALLFAITGLANVLLYVIARGIQLSHR